MSAPMLFGGMTALAVAGLLVAEGRGSRVGVWVAKPLASTGFLLFAIALGALDSTYGIAVVAALAASWLGDVLLIPRAPRIFQAGILAFLVGHVLFALAFVLLGIDRVWLLASILLLGPALVGVARWLQPHLDAEWRAPVYAYMLVISVMVACAFGAVGAGASIAVLVGAVGFYVSDLSVARDRFVVSTPANHIWGLPLYYGAQLVLASTVAA